MALTVEDVIRRLQLDSDDVVIEDMQYFLDVATQAVRNHIKTKFDAENVVHQHAIIMLCGYYSSQRELGKDMVANGSFLPDPVLALLNPYYVPLVI